MTDDEIDMSYDLYFCTKCEQFIEVYSDGDIDHRCRKRRKKHGKN